MKGVIELSQYIDNVNTYISQMKIKQTYISMKTGIDTKKLSRILTGKQDITFHDMEKIAHSLGKKMDFFITEQFEIPQINHYRSDKIAFYAGNPTKEQELIASQLLLLMENIDEVISAKGRFLNISQSSFE